MKKSLMLILLLVIFLFVSACSKNNNISISNFEGERVHCTRSEQYDDLEVVFNTERLVITDVNHNESVESAKQFEKELKKDLKENPNDQYTYSSVERKGTDVIIINEITQTEDLQSEKEIWEKMGYSCEIIK